MSSPKVSIIIPIYNSEKYIHQCIDSVLNQTLKDIEIILMDDGSSDNSSSICDIYARKDKRIKVIHKKNSGYGDNVNKGIQLATGEYIGIVEGDDFVEPDMYEKLYNNAHLNNTDITKCYFYFFNQFRKKQNKKHLFIKNSVIEPRHSFSVKEYPLILTYHASIWAAIYRRSFIQNIKLPTTPRASYQDFPFVFEALLKAKNISIVPEYLIHYRCEKKQNSSSVKPGRDVLYLIEHAQYIQNLLKNMCLYQKYKKEFFRYITSCLYGYFRILPEQYAENYYTELVKFYKKNKADIPWKELPPNLNQFIHLLILDKKNELFLIKKRQSKLYKTCIRLTSCFILNPKKRHAYRNKKLYNIRETI